ncbi:MAG TPA: tetratricopeptide repeat protein [Myxococcaceae bacterium]|nr:tetratricopeptide repeat protein [Myxococcaceae bacterium]
MSAISDLLSQGRTREARQQAERVLAEKPQNAEALVAVAKAQLVEGDLGPAEANIKKAEAAGAAPAEVLVMRGALAGERNQVDEALSLYQQALKLDPGRAESEFGVAVMLAEQTKYTESLPHFERAVKLQPRAGVLHYHLAQNLIRVDQHQRAFEHLEQAVTLNPLYPPAYQLLAKVLCILGKQTAAKRLLEEGLKLLPGDVGLRGELTNVLVQLGDARGAEALARAVAKDVPDNLAAQENFVLTLVGAEKFREAMETMKALDDKGVRTATLRSALAICMQAKSPPDLIGAMRCYEEAMQLDPEDWHAACDLGLMLLQKGEPKEMAVTRAITVLEEARRRAPRRQEVLLNLALAYVRTGDRARSLDLAKQVVDLQLPDGDPAREQAERLVKKLGAS